MSIQRSWSILHNSRACDCMTWTQRRQPIVYEFMSRAKSKNQLTQLHSPDDLEPTLLFAETFKGENGGLLAIVSLDAELMVGALDSVKSAEGSVAGELMVGALDSVKSAEGSVAGELMVGDRDDNVVSLVVGESVEGLV
jgi:hypothetical protein